MAIQGFLGFVDWLVARCAVTGLGGHLILGYQKSVTTQASHSADSWVLHLRLKTGNRNSSGVLFDQVCTPNATSEVGPVGG